MVYAALISVFLGLFMICIGFAIDALHGYRMTNKLFPVFGVGGMALGVLGVVLAVIAVIIKFA